MTDPLPLKSRIPRWGRLLAATVLVVVALLGIRWGFLMYRQQKALAKFMDGDIFVVVADTPKWLPEWVGGELKLVFSSRVEITLRHNFGDEDLRQLEGVTKPLKLSLARTQATDAGLVHLRGLTYLEHLTLDGTQITDAGLTHLAGLTNLQYLGLDGTQVTDAGLRHLTSLTNLRTLFLQQTQTTNAGIAKLKAALPDCHIIRVILAPHLPRRTTPPPPPQTIAP